MRNKTAKAISLGGVSAALALVIMCMGGLIPVATYICPILCTLILEFVLQLCGTRIAWAWYGAVAILSVLLGPDKEAAAIFLCLGYYPILKLKFDKLRMALLWKLLLFNSVICLTYWILMRFLGMEQVATEFEELGTVFLVILLALGNLTFFFLDKLLKRLNQKFSKQSGG